MNGREALTDAVRRALAYNEHEIRPGVIDTLAADVVSELLSVEDGRLGWLLDGNSEEVRSVFRVKRDPSSDPESELWTVWTDS